MVEYIVWNVVCAHRFAGSDGSSFSTGFFASARLKYKRSNAANVNVAFPNVMSHFYEEKGKANHEH